MKIAFRKVRLSKENKERLALINSIVEEYQRQGYKLTLRQLYYQLVTRNVIRNKQSEYAKLSTLLKEGRMGGVVDWDAIEDRLRTPERPSVWDSPKQIMTAAARGFRLDHMRDNPNYVEVWVEKDALSGVLSRVTEQYHVNILVNRGYSSASAMYDAWERFKTELEKGKSVTILYLGDFDPSGLDMIRDIRDRVLEMLLADVRDFEDAYDKYIEEDGSRLYDLEDMYGDDPKALVQDWADGNTYFDPMRAWVIYNFTVKAIALSKEQIDQYDPPPNPAKLTDPRSQDFIRKHGGSSWEVDALRPEVLHKILEDAIVELIDEDKKNAVLEEEAGHREKLDMLLELADQDNEMLKVYTSKPPDDWVDPDDKQEKKPASKKGNTKRKK